MAKGHVYGFDAIQVYKYYNGYAFGQIADPTTPGTNVTSHAYAMFNGISASLPAVSRALATFRGGSVPLGSAFLGVEALTSFDISLSAFDNTLNTMVGNGNADTTTVSGWEVSGMNEQNPTPNQLGIVLNLRIQRQDAGYIGDNYFLNVFFPNVTCTYNQIATITQDGGENPSPSTLTVAPAASGKFASGIAFSSNQNFKNNATACYFVMTTHPLAVTTYIADGAATTFTLGYRPQYSTVTTGNTNNSTAKNGTATAVTSINTTTGLVTIASAGTAADKWVVTYPTNWVAP